MDESGSINITPETKSLILGNEDELEIFPSEKSPKTNNLIILTMCRQQKIPLRQNRFIVIILCTIYAGCTGSIYYGWPGLTNMLFRDGSFSWLCKEENKVEDKRYLCEDQDSAVQRLFQIAMTSQYIMSVVAGTLIDNVGPRFTAVIGQSINFIAWLLLSFANENFNVYILAFILIGLGSDTGFLPTLQSANLFPGYNGVIISILGAANSLSFSVPTIMDALSVSFNIKFSYICYGYLILVFFMILYSLFGFPLKPFKDQEYFLKQQYKPHKEILSSYTNILKDEISSELVEQNTSIWHRSFQEINLLLENLKASRSQFFTLRFAAISFYFCTTSLILNFYIISGEHLLSTKVNTFYGIMNPFSFIPTIFYGHLVDSIGPVKVMIINTTFGLISYIFAIVPSDENLITKYISAIGMAIYVSIYTSQMYFFIKDRFEDAHFNKLIGMASMFGGLFSLFSVFLYDPITKSTFNSNFIYVSCIMIFLCILNYISFYFMKGHSKFMEFRNRS